MKQPYACFVLKHKVLLKHLKQSGEMIRQLQSILSYVYILFFPFLIINLNFAKPILKCRIHDAFSKANTNLPYKEKCLVTQKLCIVFGNISRPKVFMAYMGHLKNMLVFISYSQNAGKNCSACHSYSFGVVALKMNGYSSVIAAASQKATERFSKLLLLFHSAELCRPDHIAQVLQFCLSFQRNLILCIGLTSYLLLASSCRYQSCKCFYIIHCAQFASIVDAMITMIRTLSRFFWQQ